MYICGCMYVYLNCKYLPFIIIIILIVLLVAPKRYETSYT